MAHLSRIRLVLAVLLVAAMIAPVAGLAAPALVFDDRQEEAGLEGHVDRLRDPTGQLTLDDVVFGAAAGNFQPVRGDIGLGYTNDAVWLRFQVTRVPPGGSEIYLQFVPNFLSTIAVYQPLRPDPSGPGDYRRLSLDAPAFFSHRPFVSIERVFALEVPAGETFTFYARVRTMGSMALALTLRSGEAQAAHALRTALFAGAYQGTIAVMVLANLLFFIVVRTPLYLNYALFLAAIAGFHFLTNGLARFFFPGLTATGLQAAIWATWCAQSIFGPLFFRDALAFGGRRPWVDRVSLAVAGISTACLALTAAGLLRPFASALVLVQLGFLFFCLVTVTANLVRRPTAYAVWVFIAFTPQYLGGPLALLRAIGIVPQSGLSYTAYQVATLAHVLLMNVVLGGRVKLSQAMAVEAARASEQRAQTLAEQRTRDLAAAKARAEAALAAEQEAQAEQVRLVDMISHQYRTPLSTIRNSADSIALALADDDIDNRHRVERIGRAVARLSEILDITLHPRRIEHAATDLNRQPLAVGPFLSAAAQRARDGHPGRRIDLEIDAAAAAAVVSADAALLDIALANLVENALKFSPTTRPVTLSATLDGAAVRVTIADRGIGIPPGDLHLIFRKYYRAANAANHAGMGVGLRLVRQIVEAHAGRIAIDSREDHGTAITVELPLGG